MRRRVKDGYIAAYYRQYTCILLVLCGIVRKVATLLPHPLTCGKSVYLRRTAMRLSKPSDNTPQQPPGGPPRPKWYALPLSAFEAVWAFYWPNATWSLIGLVNRNPHGMAALLNSRLVANALYLTNLFPAVWKDPLLGWPSFIGLIVLGLSLARRYGSPLRMWSCWGQPNPPPTTSSEEIQELRRQTDDLSCRVGRLEHALDQLRRAGDDPLDESGKCV